MVNYIWGDNIGEVWNESLDLTTDKINNIMIFPNPSSGIINFNINLNNEKIQIFSLRGEKILELLINNTNRLELELPVGFYIIRSLTKYGILNSKVVIR